MKNSRFKFSIISICLLFGCSFATHADTKQAQPTHDIRILIDVSGSMKWNDPHNLRIPALRLLANLLPSNAQAGVWTFGRQVNMLVPLGKVDNRWKQSATKAAGEIHSRGLFTNLEETLASSTWDWRREDENFARTIILLTDGLVDIATDPHKNHVSRQRILNEIIPRLAKAGATIHTIALSGDADERLLQQLAAASNGWYEKVKSAENLERIFFHMFEKTTQPETLPLIDNQVIVDNSIKEMTLLIFNRGAAQAVMLTTPKEQTFDHNNAPENVNWRHESRYDLITINAPDAGSWHVDADIDPDNRIMVVTDLKMATTSFPNNIYLGDEHTYFVSLTNQGEVITKQGFHRFVDITLQQTHNNESSTHKLNDDGNSPDGNANDGTYSIALGETLTEGRHELATYVDGTTFRREKRVQVNVHASPVITSITAATVLNAEIATLSIIPRADMIKPDSIKIIAAISTEDGEIQRLEIPRSSHNEWQLPLGDFAPEQQHNITIEIDGIRPNGKPVANRIGPLAFGDSAQPAVEIAPTTAVATIPATREKPVEAEIRWIAVMIPIVMFNLLLGCGAYFAYRKWKTRPKSVKEKPWETLAHD